MQDFITIQEFMRKDLNLSGNDLLVYAIIYGFSKDGESKFYGSRQYISDWCGISVRQVQTILNKLVDCGLLTKYEDFRNKNKNCQYVANFTPSEKTSPPSEEISPPPSEKTSLYNIDNNNLKDNIENNTKVLDKKIDSNNRYDQCYSLIRKKYDGELLEILTDYLNIVCGSLKGVNQWKGMLSSLDKLDGDKVAIVKRTIERGWFSFYSLPNGYNATKPKQEDYWSKRDTQQSSWAKDEDINYDERY